MPKKPGLCSVKRGVKSGKKESEQTVAPALLAQLDLARKVVTGDALYAQRELSRYVVERGGDYLWMIKGNQPTLRDAVSLLFAQPPWGEEFPEARQDDSHGGRREQRWLRSSAALNEYLEWPNLGQVCCLERTRTRKGDKSVERAYAITSLNQGDADPERLLKLWRSHWRIENQVHWVRDVTFDEDRCQVRTGAAPQVMAALRNLVIGLVRRTRAPNVAAALRHYGWKPSDALALINQSQGEIRR